ncbi:MAG TPA: hypothetical protein PKC39_14620 [Ferruginibacter sp.]|nr:hypothetical protein [Ferruginibacter sp.]HMP22190.1 hypothetical protein [Ferruginibacter sp.]
MTAEQLTELDITEEQWALMGPVEKLYLDVTQRLKDSLPELAWIELECGQLEIPEDTYPVQFPCALIDFPSIETQDETLGNQQAIIMLQLRIGIDLYEDLYIADGNRTVDTGKALQRLSLITAVHAALQLFETDYSTPLTRAGIQTERRDDGIKVFSLLYGCAAKDDTGAKRFDILEGLALKVNKA